MARKPTRFWHPARRLLTRAQEKVRAVVAQDDGVATLDDVRPRLQHYLRAMYGETVMIESLAPPKQAGWPARVLRQLALVKERGRSESDAERIRLPATLPAQRTDVSPLEQYRVIAVQHAERMRRASALHAREVSTDLERDLFQLAEAACVDAQIAESQPGLRAALDAARTESMLERPKPRWRTDIELRVEEMVRRAWPGQDVEAGGDADVIDVPLSNDAESNATWARRTANALEAKYGRKAARAYRRVPEITLWQTTITTQLPDEKQLAIETEMREGESESAPASQKSSSRSAMPGPSNSRSSQNKHGTARGDADSKDATGRSESGGADDRGDVGASSDDRPPEQGTASTPEVDPQRESNEERAGAVPADGAGGKDVQQGVGHSGDAVDDAMLADGLTFRYPEWDYYVQNFRASGTIVRVTPPSLASSEWATAALLEHAREVHHARRQFERLRSHRLRLRRQVQGDELDLEACVEAMVDRRMHVAPSDRLYSLVRRGRRELAITLLIDISGSTANAVAGDQRVIDLERIAALVASAAFDALGDDYSILAFSSASASNVRVHTLKDFGERNSPLVLQRISALAPHGTTRLGAAVRHATAQLAGHLAPHRLLLILSDGKPHDYDWYFVDYAIQDSRHAVLSARLQGIHPFCITIDAAEGETYLSEIFGSGGYRVVSRPSQLSQALLLAVQRMISGAG
ncbi:MAG: VWA domain-containing protein [bacterium]